MSENINYLQKEKKKDSYNNTNNNDNDNIDASNEILSDTTGTSVTFPLTPSSSSLSLYNNDYLSLHHSYKWHQNDFVAPFINSGKETFKK